jgi:hypothetical protein
MIPTARVKRILSNYLHLSLMEWPRLPFTARIERAPFHRARSASKKGTWPLPPLLVDQRRNLDRLLNQAIARKRL